MPRGSKQAYSEKQKRKAEHIEEGYEEKGVAHDEAERLAWATVNKQDGGGKISGTGRKKSKIKKSSGTKKAPARETRKKLGPKPKKRTTKKKGK